MNIKSTWKGINELLGNAKKTKKYERIGFNRLNKHDVLPTHDPKMIGNTLRDKNVSLIGYQLANIPDFGISSSTITVSF